MTFPFRFFRSQSAEVPGSDLRVAVRTDVQWGRRVFVAPALPPPRVPAPATAFPSAFRRKDQYRG